MKTKVKTNFLKMAVFLVILSVVFIAQGNNNKAFAKSKKYVYVTSMVKSIDKKWAYLGQCNKFVLKGKKLTLKGTMVKAKSENAYYDGKYKSLKYKKRTFKLAKGCKFYSSGGLAGTTRTSKKRLIKTAKLYNGLSLIVFTNKKGKVYKIIISS